MTPCWELTVKPQTAQQASPGGLAGTSLSCAPDAGSRGRGTGFRHGPRRPPLHRDPSRARRRPASSRHPDPLSPGRRTPGCAGPGRRPGLAARQSRLSAPGTGLGPSLAPRSAASRSPGLGRQDSPGNRAGLTFVLQVHQDQQEREHGAQPAAHRAGGHHVRGRLSRGAGRCAAQQPARPTARSEAPAVRPVGQRSGLSGGGRPAAENRGGRGPRTPRPGRRSRPIAFPLASERPGSPGSWLALIGCGGRRPAPPLIG